MKGTKPIPFAPHYHVTTDGTIFSTKVVASGREIKQSVRYDGQNQVSMMIDGIKKNILVKRAVAFTYLGAEDGDQVHRTGEPGDDSVDSLFVVKGA